MPDKPLYPDERYREEPHTEEPVVVTWNGGLDDKMCVIVDPYRGAVWVNGKRHDVGVLEPDP